MDSGIFIVVVGAVVVAAIARWRGWPAPLFVTLVALAVSFLPFVPQVEVDGHVLLNIVLPPLLYSAALDVSFVSFKRSLPQIRRLGIGLVLVTTVVVGLVAWMILPSLTLPGALLLGAIVAPPDAVSAAAIGRKLGLPRRIMTVISGESLINDATSLTLYRVFAAIVLGATVTLGGGIWQFVLAVVLGVAVGLVFGIVLHQLRLRITDPVVIGTFGLLVPFGAYAIAEQIQGSGVLAVVAMGLYVGFNSPNTNYTTRQQEIPLWLSADFLLESFVFAYIGLQFPRVLSDLGDVSTSRVLWLSGAVLLAVLLVRPAFVYPAYAWGQFWQRLRMRQLDRDRESGRLERRLAQPKGKKHGKELTEVQLVRRLTEPALSWKDNAVVSWAGMRGVVTLATALAATDLAGLDTGAAHAIVVVAYVVTLGTLLLQGVTLPWLIRSLGIAVEDEQDDDMRQLAEVRARTSEAGAAYLAKKRALWVEAYGEAGAEKFDLLAKRLAKIEVDTDRARESVGLGTRAIDLRPTYDQMEHFSRGWLAVRREVLRQERDAGNLSEEVMRELITAMDAEELALDTRGALQTPGRV